MTGVQTCALPILAIPTAQTILHEGDYIQAVGSEEALNQLAVLVGEREEGELPLVDMQELSLIHILAH